MKGKLRKPLEDNRGINSATQVGYGKTQRAPTIQKKTENDIALSLRMSVPKKNKTKHKHTTTESVKLHVIKWEEIVAKYITTKDLCPE